MKLARLLSAVVGLMASSGCSSPPAERFHSLLAPPPAEGLATRAAPPRSWELLPVQLPLQVDRPQWVLWRADQSLQVLEHERWASPLADELHAALSQQLARSAPALAAGAAPLRLALALQRWDAVLGGFSRIEARWSVLDLGAANVPPRHCEAVLMQPAPGGVEGLAAAHRAAVLQLGERLLASFKAC